MNTDTENNPELCFACVDRETMDTVFSFLKDRIKETYIVVNADNGDPHVISPSAKQLIGLPVAELAERLRNNAFHELVHPDDRAQFSTQLDQLRRGEIAEKDEVYRLLAGDGVVWIREVSVRITSDDSDSVEKPVNYIASLFDEVTLSLKEREALELAEEKAEHATRVKDHFLAMMSHEMRTPLSVISGFSELALTDLKDAENVHPGLRDHLQAIATASENLSALINDILDVSRIEAGTLGVSPEPTPLVDMISGFLRELRSQANRHDIHLYARIAPDMPETILVDKQRLRQIIFNIVNNGIKFTPSGGRIDISVDYEDGALTVISEDNGRGIPPEKLNKIFHAFEQVEAARTRSFGGLGLGLALVNKLCKLMNGNVYAESQIGKGSKFTVVLPLPKVTVAEKTGETETVPAQAGYKGEILIIEDTQMNQMVIEAMLDRLGVEQITITSSGEEGLIAARSMPRLILLDLHMPRQDGYQVVQAIRADDQLARLSVVALTADVQMNYADLLDAGFNDALFKPVNLKTLREVLDQYMR